MYKRKILFFAGCALLLLFTFISCKTAPAAGSDEPVENVQAATDQELREIDSELNGLASRTEEARESCLEYRLGVYRTEDWDAAEAARNEGRAAVSRVVKTSDDGSVLYITAADYALAAESFTKAIALYDWCMKPGLGCSQRIFPRRWPVSARQLLQPERVHISLNSSIWRKMRKISPAARMEKTMSAAAMSRHSLHCCGIRLFSVQWKQLL